MKKIVFCMMIVFIFATALSFALDTQSPNVRITLLNQDPTPARAGDTVKVHLIVENAGGGIVNNLQLEMLDQYPFTVVNGAALQNIGTIYGYQSGKNYINIEYTLKVDKDAINGQHEIKIRRRDDQNDWTTNSFSIDITSKQFAQIIYVDKSKLEPGKETDMKFTITNTGSSPLQNLIFSWSEPNGAVLPIYSDDTKYIKYLDIGKSADLVYKVMADVNAKPGLYKLSLNLKFESLKNSTTSVISTAAGVFIGGQTDFDVAFSQSSQGQTSLSVANTGNNPAQSVSVRIPQQENFRVAGSNSAIIGNLDKGDYTVVSFQITPATGLNMSRRGAGGGGSTNTQQRPTQDQLNSMRETVARNNNLQVVIDYTDTTGERRSVEKSVSIQFRTDTATGSGSGAFGIRNGTSTTTFFSGYTFYGIVVIVVLAAFFYRKKIARIFVSKK